MDVLRTLLTAGLLLGLITVALLLIRAVRPVPLSRDDDHGRVGRILTQTRVGRLGSGSLAIILATAFAAYGGALPGMSLGRAVASAPAVFSVVLALGVAIIETRLHPARTAVRTASTSPRRAADFLPPRVLAVVVGGLFLGVTFLVITMATSSPDYLGQPGRAFTYVCDANSSGVSSPYPGPFYAVPILLGWAVAAGVTGWGVRVAASRPVIVGSATDSVLRSRTMVALLASLGASVGVGLTACAALTVDATLGAGCRYGIDGVVYDIPAQGTAVLAVVSIVTLVLALLLLVISIALLISPSLGVRRDPSDHPRGAPAATASEERS